MEVNYGYEFTGQTFEMLEYSSARVSQNLSTSYNIAHSTQYTILIHSASELGYLCQQLVCVTDTVVQVGHLVEGKSSVCV